MTYWASNASRSAIHGRIVQAYLADIPKRQTQNHTTKLVELTRNHNKCDSNEENIYEVVTTSVPTIITRNGPYAQEIHRVSDLHGMSRVSRLFLLAVLLWVKCLLRRQKLSVLIGLL